jgi:hypothetical protein
MRARHRLIPSSFLLLLFPLILVSCSGGSAATPPGPPPAPQPPAPVGLLYRTDQTLVRSQTDGSGLVTLAEEAAGIWSVLVSGAIVVYMTPQVPYVVNHQDLWAVQTDGTDRHRLVHDPEHETYLRDVIAPWVLYDYRPGRSFTPPPPSLASLLLDGTASRILMAAEGAGELWQSPNYQRRAGGRALVEFAGNLFSLLPDGTDLRQLTFYPPFPHLNNETFTALLGVSGVVGDAAIYATVESPSSPISAEGTPKLFAVPVLGGPVVKLGDGPEMEMLMAVVGTRVVYQRCVLMFLPSLDVTFDRCNVSIVRSNGQERVVLTATSDINYVQGTIGQQVIIRRSHSGPTDELFSIPVNGGVETPILSLSYQDEFVIGIVNDRIILQRTTGIWSVQADGSELIQLTPDVNIFSVGAVGPFACFNRGVALWCVPADGSGPATKVTDHGTLVAGL